jgi:hypothetical protein
MSDSHDLQALTRTVELLMRKVDQLESVNAVRSLQYKSGYYMDQGF